MEKQKFNKNYENYLQENFNNIHDICSNYIKIPGNLFISIDKNEFNIIKCIKCNLIPLKPIVLQTENFEQKPDYMVLCKDCFDDMNMNQNSIKTLIVDKQYSHHLKLFIENKKIKCINNNLGCNWKGILFDLESHLNMDCLYKQIKCLNHECEKIILRKDLDIHLIQCEYTNKIIKAKCQFCNEEFSRRK